MSGKAIILNLENMQLDREDSGRLTVRFDSARKSVNLLNQAMWRDLDCLLEFVERDPSVEQLVFRSNKSTSFLAGADLEELAALTLVPEINAMLVTGQRVLTRLEQLCIPTVAVITGVCLGGGLEFALACRYRIAIAGSVGILGLPETQLGLIPGWGGMQRLPERIGIKAAMELLLQGRRIGSDEAKSLRLIDAVALPSGIDERIEEVLLGDAASQPSPANAQDSRALLELLDHTAAMVIGKRWRSPAEEAVIECVRAGLERGRNAGHQAEQDHFGPLLLSTESRNLRRLFFWRERAKKPSTWIADTKSRYDASRPLAIIGAGTMGAGIAQLAALNGLCVVLSDLSSDALGSAKERIEKLFQSTVRRGLMQANEIESRRNLIRFTTEWEPVAAAGLAIECVVENLEAKRDIFRRLDHLLAPDALLVSNTSALPVSRMMEGTSRGETSAGLHFFNPVHRMALVEIVRTPRTGAATLAKLIDLTRRLGKVPIVVQESPGVVVTRTLFLYLDEAVRLACEGHAFELIDAEAKRFGLPMGPLELLDHVGLATSAEILRTLTPFVSEPSPAIRQLESMIAAGRLGKKSEVGFYNYSSETSRQLSPDAASGVDLSPTMNPRRLVINHPAQLSEIAQRLILRLLLEAATCLHERLVAEEWMIDMAMSLGTAYPTWLCGPMQTIRDWGPQNVTAVLDQLSRKHGPRFTPRDGVFDSLSTVIHE